MNITKNAVRMYASPKAVIANFLHLPGADRVNNIVRRVENLETGETDYLMTKVIADFAGRHRNIEEIFSKHFSSIAGRYNGDLSHFSSQKKLLLGAFFTKEYSIQAAALFNPSIVSHPDQQGLQPGEQRFIMSLRATGEGHISSIIFKTGIIDDKANIKLEKDSGYFSCLQKNVSAVYDKDFIGKRTVANPLFDKAILDDLPDTFTASQAITILQSKKQRDTSIQNSIMVIGELLDTNYELESSALTNLDEKVIFPNAKLESMGMEDLRLVKFNDKGGSCYYGTYTAYDGKQIKTQLIETNDFNSFKIRTLYGSAISDKGMALFPEKVNGKFVMISRQGGEKISIMFSDDLYCWEKSDTLMEPLFAWELVQLGNCGSPVKTAKGWLLLTHGVGVMRTYVISAILLDLDDPTRIIGRLDKPLIEADGSERDGYVPNVVYTCGCMLHGDILMIPYAVSDSATGFATISLDDILNEYKL